jgi:hypothetical protein
MVGCQNNWPLRKRRASLRPWLPLCTTASLTEIPCHARRSPPRRRSRRPPSGWVLSAISQCLPPTGRRPATFIKPCDGVARTSSLWKSSRRVRGKPRLAHDRSERPAWGGSCLSAINVLRSHDGRSVFGLVAIRGCPRARKPTSRDGLGRAVLMAGDDASGARPLGYSLTRRVCGAAARKGAIASTTASGNSSWTASFPRGRSTLLIPGSAASASISACDFGGVAAP